MLPPLFALTSTEPTYCKNAVVKWPHEIESPEVQKLASITDILRARAAHVIYDSQLVRSTDADWAADMLVKEVAENASKSRSRTGGTQYAPKSQCIYDTISCKAPRKSQPL